MRLSLLAALAVIAGFLPTQAIAQDLLITNARVVDPGERLITAGNLLVRDGRIAGFPEKRPAGFTGTVVDAQGRWVIPALTDMHTHSFGNSAATGPGEMLGPAGVAKVALRAGVARYLDLFSQEDFIFGVRNNQRAGNVPGAEIFAAGPCLTATSGHCSEYGVPTRIVDTPEDAEREVTALAAKHPDVVKIVYDNATYSSRSMPTVNRATLEAVIAVAKEHGLKTVVHIGTWQDLRDAVEAGAAAVTHTPRGQMPDDLPALMVAHGAFHIPTLGVQGDFARYLEDPALLDSPLLAEVVRGDVIQSYRQAPDSGSRFAGWVAWQHSIISANLDAVSHLAKAGVLMLTGTDAGNPAVFQGYSVHRELRLLVEAGLSTWDALAASTTSPGRFFGRDWGLSVGSEATLLVLDGSPIDDIRNTERIHTIIQRGAVVTP
jgi:imidazolonepropionase-like amidohydrolase